MSADATSLSAFHLVGDRSGLPAVQTDSKSLRPALFAGYRDLSRLRYDFPLVLANDQGHDWVRSLADGIDSALQKVAPQGMEGEETRRQVLSLEQQIKHLVTGGQTGSLSHLWEQASQMLGDAANESVRGSLLENLDKARAELGFDGEVIDCDVHLPTRLIGHAWQKSQQVKALQLHARINRLLSKLSDILRVDYLHSSKARDARHLESSLGARDHVVFDFQAMARILKSAPVGQRLPKKRQRRINEAIAVLKSQGFVAADGSGTPLGFAYDDCTTALAAFRERLPAMAALVKAISIAELESENRYDEAQHDTFFGAFDQDNLGPGDLALFPSYLVCLENGSDAVSTQASLELLRTGLPFKIVVVTDDIAGEVATAVGQLSFGTRGQQLAGMAVGLSNVFVMQASAAALYRLRDFIMQGLASDRSALFSVYSDAQQAHVPYLVAAAATESRAFPSFVYNPSTAMDMASRFHLDGNPQCTRDWSRHTFQYESGAHDTKTEDVAFTPVDFMACDRRFASHFACVGSEQWDSAMLPVDTFLTMDAKSRSGKVPYILLVDENAVLHRAVCDDKLIDAALRCRDRWHGLQELGGINNSHAIRALAEAKKAEASRSPAAGNVATTATAPPEVKNDEPQAATPAIEAAAELLPPEEAAPPADDPWIETIRCTTCNECTELNDRMFAYDEDKRAYIVDPDAGTYRELVEAAETCQVAIIHPGKPRNPDEPGLEELLERAEPFNV